MFDIERGPLVAASRSNLADRASWRSEEIADCEGFNIESFSDQSRVLYIDAETTMEKRSALLPERK